MMQLNRMNMKSIYLYFVGSLLALLFVPNGARAQPVEVAPGIEITARTFAAIPVEEQPFYGFAAKSPAQRAADQKFIASVIAAVGERKRAVDELVRRGWMAFSSGNHREAGLRFNQAYLVDAGQSSVYHGFAVLAATRLNDPAYAEELFRIAKKLPNPLPHLNADFGRLLLINKKPEALALLELSVVDQRDSGMNWSNLGFARLQNGDRVGACAAADEAAGRAVPNERSDIAILKAQSGCR
jgi:hypothetical protein